MQRSFACEIAAGGFVILHKIARWILGFFPTFA